MARTAAPVHDHAWTLEAVSYEDGATVREFVCSGCGDVHYR